MKPTNAVEAAVDALAVHRLTRLVQDDEVWPMPELREAYLRRVGDSRWADLATCPWCLGVWIAGGVVVARVLFPRAWPWVARMLAGSAAAGHLGALSR